VANGQTYRISVHQVDGASRQVIGAFEMVIPVRGADVVLEEEARTLSVLGHIATTIPINNRWYPIFQRYLHLLGTKVDELGGDASSIHPNPDGSGRLYVPPPQPGHGGFCVEGWATSLLAAVGLVLAGLLEWSPATGAGLVVVIALLVLVIARWARTCCGRIRCAMLDRLTLGTSLTAAALGLAIVGGQVGARATTVAAAASILTVVLVAASFWFRCRGSCCDGPDVCNRISDEQSQRTPTRIVAGPRPDRRARE
jgi:hypothetical protein